MKRFLHSESGDRGWFVGPFERAVFKTDACEVAYQFNRRGEISPKHTHRVATEINLVTSGSVIINDEMFNTGEGYIMYPGDVCQCWYVADTTTLVVKVPGVLGDKYLL
jgi:quercetin dioxygenase-like cupin family protein